MKKGNDLDKRRASMPLPNELDTKGSKAVHFSEQIAENHGKTN